MTSGTQDCVNRGCGGALSSGTIGLWVGLMLGAACQEAPDTARMETPSVAKAALSVRPLALATEEVLLDGDGALFLIGALEPAPPNADPPLRLKARIVGPDGSTSPFSHAGTVIDRARLAPGGVVLLLTSTGELLRVDLKPGGGERVLDHGVVGAVGASLDGRALVYTKGEPPELEVWRLAADGARPKQVSAGMAPAWSPGISPDGQVVYVVSGRGGSPAWWRLEDGAEPKQLTNVGVKFTPDAPPPDLAPFASGLGPTLVGDDVIVFEARDTVHVMTTDGRVVKSIPYARAPHWERPGKTIGYLDTNAGAVLSMPLAEVAP